MSDQELLKQIKDLVLLIKHYESTYDELPTRKLKSNRKKLILKHRIQLNDLLFGNI